jgi:hypothetical protein
MSSLIVATDETQVIVATDTLATHPDGRPIKFTTKAFVVPHLNLIMASTGVMGFLGRWFVRVNDMVIAKGIDNLDYHAPGILSSLWEGCKQELSIPEDVTTSIYHFGISESTGVVHSYRYRSPENFRSDRIEPYGFLVKPECQIPENITGPESFITMMDEQRLIQSSKPKNERVYVGGEIHIHRLSQDGYQMSTLHRFEDYNSDETAIHDARHIAEVTRPK